MQDSRRIHHVEGAGPQTRAVEIRLDELHVADVETPRGRGAELERRARQIGGHDHAIRAREIQRHLTGSAADLDDPRIAGDGAIEQPRESAPLRTRS